MALFLAGLGWRSYCHSWSQCWADSSELVSHEGLSILKIIPRKRERGHVYTDAVTSRSLPGPPGLG
jgi:hypothetical protein